MEAHIQITNTRVLHCVCYIICRVVRDVINFLYPLYQVLTLKDCEIRLCTSVDSTVECSINNNLNRTQCASYQRHLLFRISKVSLLNGFVWDLYCAHLQAQVQNQYLKYCSYGDLELLLL